MKKNSMLIVSTVIFAMVSCKTKDPGSCLLFEGRFTAGNQSQIFSLDYDSKDRIISIKFDGQDYADYNYYHSKIILTEKLKEAGITHYYLTTYNLDSMGRVVCVTNASSKTTFSYNAGGYLTRSERIALNGDYKKTTDLTYIGGNLTKLEIKTDGQLSERYIYTYGTAPGSPNFTAFDSIESLQDHAGLLKNNFGKRSKNQLTKCVFQSLPDTQPGVSAITAYDYITDSRGNVTGLRGTSEDYSFQIAYKYNCK